MTNSEPEEKLPRQPIDRIVQPLARFLHVESASGIVLLVVTLVALGLANSPWSDSFLGFWKTKVGIEFGSFQFRHSLKHLINDGAMAVFFFVIGLEVKRELFLGELREPRKAILPVVAAIGGMVVPASFYLAVQWGQPAQRGWGIPMATDIAFVVGCMAVLGPRVPHGLRVMLLSLAIVDDIGAILVIAIGYTEEIHTGWLVAGIGGIGFVSLIARLGVRSIPVYTVVGIGVWFSFHESGIHATIAGVILGLMTPARSYVPEGMFGEMLNRARSVFEGGGWETVPRRVEKLREFRKFTRETISPLEYLENTLHPWVGFVIMPIFALANAGVQISASDLSSSLTLAVVLGLALGKPVGILLCVWLTVKVGIARLPDGVTWGLVTAGGCLCGIGFTMAIFIAGLALEESSVGQAKVGVLVGSVISAVAGMILFWVLLSTSEPNDAVS